MTTHIKPYIGNMPKCGKLDFVSCKPNPLAASKKFARVQGILKKKNFISIPCCKKGWQFDWFFDSSLSNPIITPGVELNGIFIHLYTGVDQTRFQNSNAGPKGACFSTSPAPENTDWLNTPNPGDQ